MTWPAPNESSTNLLDPACHGANAGDNQYALQVNLFLLMNKAHGSGSSSSSSSSLYARGVTGPTLGAVAALLAGEPVGAGRGQRQHLVGGGGAWLQVHEQ